jgi:signal transduction histidine kinase
MDALVPLARYLAKVISPPPSSLRAAASLRGLARRVGTLSGRIIDLVLPIGTGLFLVMLVVDQPQPPPPVLEVIGCLAGVVQGVALFWRRSRPRTVMLVTVLGGIVVLSIAPDGLFPFSAMVALWSLAVAGPVRASLLGLAGTLGATAPGWSVAASEDVAFVTVLVVAVWALGEAARNRLVATERASRHAVAVEQANLARDLHDVIAHGISVMVIQAAAGDDVFDTHPDRARAALRTIEVTGREAMAELRRLLAALGPSQAAGLTPPAPDLDAIDGLLPPLRDLGLTVELRREGDQVVTVPPGVALSAFRIVQEALTNTVRHARARRVEVRIHTGATALELSVTDDGCGVTHPAEREQGRGIPGMRERVSMLGGTLDIGPAPDGGFRVRARLPLETPS